MERAEEQQWEQELPEEDEEAAATLRRRKFRGQSQHANTTSTAHSSSTVAVTSNGDRSNNGISEVNSTLVGISGANDSTQAQEEEGAEELRNSENGARIDDIDKMIGEEAEQQRSEYCVYYDTDKGIWKCRLCSWDYQCGTGFSDHGQNPMLQWSFLMTLKTLERQGPCFIHETEDIGNGLTSVISNQHEEHPKHENFSKYSHQPSKISVEERKESSNSSNALVSADIVQITDSYHEATELDVETVLKKQDTHDLFCPNCQSCITKRVILRKRKRRVRTSVEDAKRNKQDSDAINDQASSGVDIFLEENEPPALNDDNREREPDIFRCLSCLSIFIPTGNGFKLFRMFGDNRDKEDLKDSQKISATNKSWFSSIFAFSKGQMLTEQGTDDRSDREENVARALIVSSNLDEPNVQASSRQVPNTNAAGLGVDTKGNYDELHIASSKLNEPKGLGSSTQEAQPPAQFFSAGHGNIGASESEGGGDCNLPSSTQGPTTDDRSDGEESVAGALILSSNLDEPNVHASSRQVPNSNAACLGGDMKENYDEVHLPSSKLNEPKGLGSSTQEAQPAAQIFAAGLGNIGASESQGVGDSILPSSLQGHTENGRPIADLEEKLDDTIRNSKGEATLDHFEVKTARYLNSYSFSNNMLHVDENDCPDTTSVSKPPLNVGESAEYTVASSQQNGLKLLAPSNVGSLIAEHSQMGLNFNAFMPKITSGSGSDQKETALLLSAPASVLGESNMDGKVNSFAHISSVNEHCVGLALPIGCFTIGTEDEKGKVKDGMSEVSQHQIVQNNVGIHLSESLKIDNISQISPMQNALLLQVGKGNLSKDLKHAPAENTPGKDTIITVETLHFKAASQSARNLSVSSETGALPLTQSGNITVKEKGTAAREVHGVDIIKSVVYGGLIESITSLGVVSSAAGADAATLNVLALGLANLFGGLFVIGHDLWNLKNDHSASDQVREHLDRYQELLGQRSNFLLHTVVAVLSYLIFGLLPPVIYGFSFRKSDDRDLKLLIVAAASLMCILILAAGKAYVKRPPKSYFKTIMYYVALGLMVSGVSYAVGSLIERFLEKVGIFQSSSAVTLPFQGVRSTELAWGAY